MPCKCQTEKTLDAPNTVHPDEPCIFCAEKHISTAMRLEHESGYLKFNRQQIIGELVLAQWHLNKDQKDLAEDCRVIRHLVQNRRESEIGNKWELLCERLNPLVEDAIKKNTTKVPLIGSPKEIETVYVISNVEYPEVNKLKVKDNDLLIFLNTAKSIGYYADHVQKMCYHRKPEDAYGQPQRCPNLYVFNDNKEKFVPTIPKPFIEELKKSYEQNFEMSTEYCTVQWLQKLYKKQKIVLVNFCKQFEAGCSIEFETEYFSAFEQIAIASEEKKILNFANLCSEFGSDKSTRHTYAEAYTEIISPLQGRKAKILEIGVRRGASLKVYQKLLPDAEIHGVDIQKVNPVDGLHIHIGNGYDQEFLTREFGDSKFDLIIDDGSHKVDDMLAGIPWYIDHLTDTGVMTIEDIATEEDAEKLKTAVPDSILKDWSKTGKKRYDDRMLIYRRTSPVDIMVPLGTGSKSNNDELRLLLRSIEKNVKNLGKIFIATPAPPDWIQNVEIVNVSDIHKHNKDANLIDKFLTVCKMNGSNRIVRTSDDQIFLRETDLSALPVFCRGKAPSSFGTKQWSARMVRTGEWLQNRGHNLAVSFDTHCPQIYTRSEVVELLNGLDYQTEPGFCINTLLMGLRGCRWGCHQTAYKTTFESEQPSYDWNDDKWFLGYNDNAFLHGLREKLFETFPEKSKYEV